MIKERERWKSLRGGSEECDSVGTEQKKTSAKKDKGDWVLLQRGLGRKAGERRINRSILSYEPAGAGEVRRE